MMIYWICGIIFLLAEFAGACAFFGYAMANQTSRDPWWALPVCVILIPGFIMLYMVARCQD